MDINQTFFTKDKAAVLTGFVVFGLALFIRILGISQQSLTLDESTLLEFAKGIIDTGFPSIFVGSMEVPLATYELVPYPIALSIALFGDGEFATRLPATLFGSGTALLLFVIGRKWFDWRVGLFAGVIFAFSPWSIYWAQNCFHPSQTQFFTLLFLYFAHRLITEETSRPMTSYMTVLLFSISYLSWEGVGFILPIILVSTLIVSWNQWKWVRNSHLWIAIGITFFVVAVQAVRRMMLQVPYLMVGAGKSDVSTPVFAFTRSEYSPYFYIKNFLFMENHIVLTVVLLAGLILLYKSFNYRFVFTLSLMGVFFMTNFLPFYNTHYVYYLLPMYMLAASASTMYLADESRKIISNSQIKFFDFVGYMVFGVALIFIVKASTINGMKFYDMSERFETPSRAELRWGMVGIDYRGLTSAFLKYYQADDIVILMAPLATKAYSQHRGDYFLQTITNRKVIFDPNSEIPRYVDKYVGNPILRTQDEFLDVLNRYDRVWILAAPYGGFEDVVDDETKEYISDNMEIVVELSDAKLLLWNRAEKTF